MVIGGIERCSCWLYFRVFMLLGGTTKPNVPYLGGKTFNSTISLH